MNSFLLLIREESRYHKGIMLQIFDDDNEIFPSNWRLIIQLVKQPNRRVMMTLHNHLRRPQGFIHARFLPLHLRMFQDVIESFVSQSDFAAFGILQVYHAKSGSPSCTMLSMCNSIASTIFVRASALVSPNVWQTGRAGTEA